MTRDPLWTTPETHMDQISPYFDKFSGLPVMQHGKVIGEDWRPQPPGSAHTQS